MSHLPEEVIADILSRLPVKPLVRFKLVSIPWRTLIESPNFVKLHLNRSIETQSNLSLIVREEEHLYSADFDSLDGGSVDAVKLDHHPLRCQDYGPKLWGSCDGLICLCDWQDTEILWNPSTRKSRKLPYEPIKVPNRPRYYMSRVYGLGYDSVTDDYKVVRIVVLHERDADSLLHEEVKVYSLKSNSWHRVGKFPHYHFPEGVWGVQASGNLHWVVNQDPKPRKIVSFNLGCEEYGLVPLPSKYSEESEYSKQSEFYIKVVVLGGCLTLICDYSCLTRVDIWVMKEYGVQESWTKLISIAGVTTSFQIVRPVAYSKNGGKVLLQHGPSRLLWCDLKRKTCKSIRIRDLQELLQVELCVGSLVSLDSDGGEVDQKKRKEQEERNMGGFLSTGSKLVL